MHNELNRSLGCKPIKISLLQVTVLRLAGGPVVELAFRVLGSGLDTRL